MVASWCEEWWNATGCEGAEMRLLRVSEHARISLYHEIFNLLGAIGRGEVDVRHADSLTSQGRCQHHLPSAAWIYQFIRLPMVKDGV